MIFSFLLCFHCDFNLAFLWILCAFFMAEYTHGDSKFLSIFAIFEKNDFWLPHLIFYNHTQCNSSQFASLFISRKNGKTRRDIHEQSEGSCKLWNLVVVGLMPFKSTHLVFIWIGIMLS